MIEIENLTHIYPKTRKTPPRKALDDLSLAVADGEFCILSGPNGSGKSTLFRILCGMALPSAGRITVAGCDLLKNPSQARREMGVVFQSPAIDKYLSVAENLAIHADLYGLQGRDFIDRRDEALAWTGLQDRLNARVDTLSGGLARQLELANCLLTRPKLLLLDEPTTGLDPGTRRAFVSRLKELRKERGMTVLMTSHVFVEAEEADRVAVMKAGRLLAFDTPQALCAGLGREMVVLRTNDTLSLSSRIKADTGLAVRSFGDEIRLGETGNGDSLPILEKLLGLYRAEIESISIKRPGLEDVFIDLTGAPGHNLAEHDMGQPQ